MPLAEPVVGLFTDEWARFSKGWAQLTADEREQALQDYRRSKASPDGSYLISMPGWTEILHTSVPYQPSATESKEYYAAKRAQRAPDLPRYVTQELQRREALKERIARDPAPAYAQSFGSILTALDNVQDFMSTLATAGRLGLWGLGSGVQQIIPGATRGTATALGEVAARRAAATAAAEFAETVAARAAAGNLVARLALNNPALYAVAEREAVQLAARTAFRVAFDRAALGLAARLAARFIPVVGWIVLASDLLNLLSFLAMAATPVYALLCGGPQAALAAGVPAALFKQALKRESWRAHNLNPFSRQARASRLLRSAGRLPSISNLLEVAQTTDQLFGIGISLGGLVGLLNGLSFGLYQHAQGKTVEFAGQPDVERNMNSIVATGAQADPALAALLRGEEPAGLRPPRQWNTATRRMYQQAGTVAATAPAVLAVQEHFDERTHVLVLLAVMEAHAMLRRLYRGDQLPELVPAALDARWPAPLSVAADTVAWAEATGRDLDRGRRWWLPGAPEAITGTQYVEHHAAALPGALREFLAPRRSAPVAALYGAAWGQAGEAAWLTVENDPDLFRWELTPDARLVSSFTEDGFIIAPQQNAERVWAMWQEAKAELLAQNGTSLRPGRWPALAAKHGVGIITLLPQDAPVPAAWAGSGFSNPA